MFKKKQPPPIRDHRYDGAPVNNGYTSDFYNRDWYRYGVIGNGGAMRKPVSNTRMPGGRQSNKLHAYRYTVADKFRYDRPLEMAHYSPMYVRSRATGRNERAAFEIAHKRMERERKRRLTYVYKHRPKNRVMPTQGVRFALTPEQEAAVKRKNAEAVAKSAALAALRPTRPSGAKPNRSWR